MNEFNWLGKYLIISGVILIILGAGLIFSDKMPLFWKTSWRYCYKGENFYILLSNSNFYYT